MKTDAIDAKTLAHLLRTGFLPEAYVAPRELRDLRELLRHRATLTRMTREAAAKIKQTIRMEDGWRQLKRGGVGSIPQGDASQAAERLTARLRDAGLSVVPVGELERWAPAISGHGPSWAAGALEARFHETSGAHRRFVVGAAASITGIEIPAPDPEAEPGGE